jgi:hypothetical protein
LAVGRPAARSVAVLAPVVLLVVLGSLAHAAQQAPLSSLGWWGSVAGRAPGLAALVQLPPTRDRDLRALVLGPPTRAALDGPLARTAAAAHDDAVLAQARALAMVRMGDVTAGEELSTATYPADPRSSVVLARAEVLLAAGHVTDAVELVRAAQTSWAALGRPGIEGLTAWLEVHAPPTDEPNGAGPGGTAGQRGQDEERV